MEAALKAATEAFTSAGRVEGQKALKAAITARYLSTAPAAEAAKLSSEALNAAKKIGTKPEEFTLPTPKGDAEAEKSLKSVSTVTKANVAEATTAAKAALAAFQKAGDKNGEAAALNLVANAYLVNGEPVSAVRTARQALSIFLEADNKSAEVPILETLMYANIAKKDVDEAMRAANEMAKIAAYLGKKKSASYALGLVADVSLVAGCPSGAVKAAEEAAEFSKQEKDAEGQAAALSMIYKTHRILGKPASAMKAATEARDLVKGKKGAEAAASLMMADSHPSSKDALAAARSAVELFRDSGDKSGEAAAMVALSIAHVSQAQKQFDEGLTAAQGAMTIFKEKGDKGGQALAASATAMALILKEDPAATETAAKEAVAVAKETGDSLVQAYASSLLGSVPFVGLTQTPAKLFFDENGCALVEVSDLATQDSCEAIIQTLQNYSTRGRGVKALALHVEGIPCPASLQCHAIRTGAFILGIRSTGFPCIGSACGKISGPSWGLFLASDYRVAAQDATFMTPIWGPPECLPDLLGPSVATHLCLSHGPMTALSMLEMGAVQQAQPNRDAAQRSASEFCKRTANFPGIASRQTMCLMSPDVEKYALSFAKFGK